MRGWKRILALALCLCMIQVPVLTTGSIQAQAAGKTGLFRENGKFYYYSNDKKLVSRWKKVKVKLGDTTQKYRFYFGSDGAAYTGTADANGIMTLLKKKIGGKAYGFDQLGHMLKGVYFSKGKFFAFNSGTGVYDKKSTKQLRAAMKEGTDYETLIGLLDKLGYQPKAIQTDLQTNYGNGTGNIYSYEGFDVHVFKDAATGKLTIMTVMATPLTGHDAQQGTDISEAETSGVRLQKTNGKYYGYDGSGALVKSQWATINGARYYFKADGSAQTGSAKIDGKRYLFDGKGCLLKDTKDRFVTLSNKLYFVYKDGSVATGWLVVDKALYYANAKGVIKRNKKTSEGIAFDATGKAKSSTAANLKITAMQIVASITNGTMTKEQKLKACWDYVVSGQRFNYYPRTPDFTQKGWQKGEALTMFNTRAGGSYGFACAFAALASELGYSPFVVAGKVSSKSATDDGLTEHCWVIIDQKYYDPGAQFRGWWTGVYGLESYDIRNLIQYKVNFRKDV